MPASFDLIIKNGKCINKKTNQIIRALVVVHVFGHPVNMNEIKMLQQHMMKMENLIQAIEKAQAPIPVADGGRIDKALGGRSRDIG